MTVWLPPATDRMLFRHYREEDAPAVAAMFNDAEARRFYPELSEPGEAAKWIAWNLTNYELHGFGLWALEERATGQFLGDCGLTYQTVGGDVLLEVGYHLDARHRGKGYATEAGRACVRLALDHIGASLVCSIVDADNSASIAVAERIHRNLTRDDQHRMLLYWTQPTDPQIPRQPHPTDP